MPKPNKGEGEKDYIARFMASDEARRDYPDEKQRAAVAYSMWEKRNDGEDEQAYEAMVNSAEAVSFFKDAVVRGKVARKLLNSGLSQWPARAEAFHLEPGVVHYQNMECPDPENPGRMKVGCTLLLKKEIIDQMRPSFPGKPVIAAGHDDVDPAELRDGIVIGSRWNGETGREDVEYFAWSDEAKVKAARGYGVSCAYYPKRIDWTPGTWHNVKYDGVILEGEYEHLALTDDPRYEGSRSRLLNDKGGVQMKNPIELLFSLVGDKKGAAKVDGDKTSVDLGGGKSVTLTALLANAMEEEDGAAAAEALKNDKTEVTLPSGKKVSIAELKAKFKAKNEKDEKDKDEKMEKRENESDEDYEKRKKEKAENEAKEEKRREEEKEKAKAENAKGGGVTQAMLDEAVGKVLSERLHKAANERGGDGVQNEYVPPDSMSEALERGQESFGMPAK